MFPGRWLPSASNSRVVWGAIAVLVVIRKLNYYVRVAQLQQNEAWIDAMRIGVTAVAALSLLFSGPASADDIMEQIDIGRRYYAEGDYSGAITELEFALNAVRNRLSLLFMATMPEPPALWSAEQASLESGTALFGGGLMITRRYREEKGNGEVRAELVVDSPMIQAFTAVLNNPIMIANEPRMERVRLGRKHALLNWNSDDQSGDISMSLGGRVLAKLEGNELHDKSILIDLMKTWDLDAVKSVAGL